MKNSANAISASQWTVISVALILAAAFGITCFMPTNPDDLQAFSLIPAIFLLVYIFFTKRVVEGLVLASVVGVIMISRPETTGEGMWMTNAFAMFSDFLLETMMDEDIAWLIIVCGLMGSIISLIEKSGGAHAFGEWAAKRATTQKSALMWTWVLGVIIFVDDYLNSLTVGACMTELTDKYKTPREFLAYVVDSTGAPACALIPISTWAVFASKILETNKWAPPGEGLYYFMKAIPYDFYAWIALFLVPMVIMRKVPFVGAMKEAVERVEKGGPLAPPGSERIDIHAGKKTQLPAKIRIYNMVIPIIVLIASTVALDVNMAQGVLVTVAFLFAFYQLQGLMTAEEFVDICLEGFKNMILPLFLMVLAFLFAHVNAKIHFTDYVIHTATQAITPNFLPIVVFITLSITEFITGTNWGMYVIALPIVIPLAQNMGADVTIAVAAVFSAGVFGSHVCFYSDATVITSAATGCDNLRHSLTQLPYGLMAAGMAACMFLAVGFF